MRNRTALYATIFWISLGVIFVWIVLKAVGVINSPAWVELIPYAGAIFAAGSFFQMIRKMESDLFSVKSRQNRMAEGLTKLEIQFNHLEKHIS